MPCYKCFILFGIGYLSCAIYTCSHSCAFRISLGMLVDHVMWRTRAGLILR
jgi:hypothetical protein